MDITDDDVPTLTLTISPPSISENGGSATVTASRNTDTTNPLTVNLSSDDTTEATVPATLVIPAGAFSAAATLTAIDDPIVDGTQTVAVSASATGFTGSSDSVEVTDDDVPTLTLTITPTSISETGGSSTIAVSRNTDTTTASHRHPFE